MFGTPENNGMLMIHMIIAGTMESSGIIGVAILVKTTMEMT